MPEDRELHSEIGASCANRWLHCPGSVRLLRGLPPRPDTEYTILGTAAHALAETCLKEGSDPADHIGEFIEVKGREVPVTEDMAEAVSVYVDKVASDRAEFGGELLVEQSFDLSWLRPGLFGRNDACLLPANWGGVIRVYDYKNGAQPVEEEENPQLMYYALGAVAGMDNLWPEAVECTIVQPNCPWESRAVRTWRIDGESLRRWAVEVLAPGADAAMAPDAPCVCGPWCATCDASGVCKARADEAVALFKASPLEKRVSLPSPDTLTPAQLGRLSSFFTSARFAAWVKALAAAELETLQSGVAIPGRKLVETESLGNRRWTDIEDVKRALGPILGAELFKSEIRSPAQVEKLLSSRKVAKAEQAGLISPLVTRDMAHKVVVQDAGVSDEATCAFAPVPLGK